MNEGSQVRPRGMLLKYHFKCECIMCTCETQTEPEVNFTEYPTLKQGLKPAFMTVEEFRQLAIETIENYEKNAIAFLHENDHYHPNSASILLQRVWIVIWNFLVTRFEFTPPRLMRNL